jgi:Tfp pilus assembly protein PilN
VSQQINLYQPIFRTHKKVFSAVTIVQIAGVFVLGLLLIYGFARWQVGGLEERVASLEAQRTTAMTQLQTLSSQQPTTSRSRLVQDQLREAEIEQQQKQRLLSGFMTRRIGDTGGFSRHLAGLARQRIDGLWLTRVIVRDDGIELAGETDAGELVPRYLARLGQEQAFAGTEFASLRLQRGAGIGTPVSFQVATGNEEPAR